MSVIRDRIVGRIFRTHLQAMLMPTFKGGDKAIKLIIRDGQRGEIHTEHWSTEAMGEMDGKVAARIRELGYELIGNERYDIPCMWLARNGMFVHLLKEGD